MTAPHVVSRSEAAVEDVRRACEARGIEFLLAQFVDLHGRARAKLVPVSHLDDLTVSGASFAGFAAGELGQSPGDPDLVAIPDLESFTHVPWEPTLARFACDLHLDGRPWPYDPRFILRRQVERAREIGFEAKLGVELEYSLLRRREDGGVEPADPLDTASKPCYDALGLSRSYDFLAAASRHLAELRWGNYANDHEDAPGQFEQNFEYADALTTCDRAIFFRYMISALAQRAGIVASFMPKPFDGASGNGCHFHVSLWEHGDNAFLDESDPRGNGLSETAYHFVGGLLKHAKAYIAVTAPTVNSYKRLGAGTATSGASWSPVYLSFGGNNRTHMIRIPAPGRVEDRTVDGSCNPYLAATVVLAAGLDGIEERLDPGEPSADNMYDASDAIVAERGYDRLPGNLLDATRELARDGVLREALGSCPGGDYLDYFVRVKQAEWRRYHAQVSSWEIDEYLNLV